MDVAMEDMQVALQIPYIARSTFNEVDIPWADTRPPVTECYYHFSGAEDYSFPCYFVCDSALCYDASDATAAILETSAGVSTSIATITASSNADERPTALDATATCDEKGVRLLHLLMAAAEALTGNDKRRELARVLLIRLKELLPPPVAAATSRIERLALYFTDALQSLVAGPGKGCRILLPQDPYGADVLTAFQLLQDMSPFTKFGHFTANQAILEAVAGERRVHVVDYNVAEGLQWASLIQALFTRKDFLGESHPLLCLRITAIVGGGTAGKGRWSSERAEETGRRLMAFAVSLGLPFSFGHCRLDRNQNFRPGAVRVVKGEAVVLNCALQQPHLPHSSAASVKSFVAGAGALRARLVTVIEEEHVVGGGGFSERFADELQRYSAIAEALEDGYRRQERARETVERLILAPNIVAAVRKAFCEDEEEKEEELAKWIEATGFRMVALSGFNLSQAKMLVGLFNRGYRVEEEALNKVVLSWKTHRLLSAAAWSAPPQPESPTVAGGFYG